MRLARLGRLGDFVLFTHLRVAGNATERGATNPSADVNTGLSLLEVLIKFNVESKE